MTACDSYFIFSGSSHPQLTEEIASNLGSTLGKLDIQLFPDGEIGVEVQSNVRGKDVFVLQSISRRPNHFLMELLIIIDALKRASARSVSAIVPYYGYARQDRKDGTRAPITAKLVANLLEKSGVTRVLTMDLHTPQIQGFFDIPVDDLYARPLLIEAVKKLNSEKLVVVSPDVGSSKMARAFASDLNADMSIIDKKRVNSSEVTSKALIGSVEGKEVLIVDDICSTAGTIKLAEKVCSRAGATKIYAAVTHYLGDETIFENCNIEKLFFTNTVPCFFESPKIEVVSAAEHFGKAIKCVLNAESISSLYQ